MRRPKLSILKLRLTRDKKNRPSKDNIILMIKLNEMHLLLGATNMLYTCVQRNSSAAAFRRFEQGEKDNPKKDEAKCSD